MENLDGQFAWAAYDVDNDELSVATDPFGMQAVFIATRNGTTYVSTSALALAKHLRARPSRLGVATFLRAGYQFGSVTNWEGIERLEPGTRIRFNGKGRSYETYWRPEVDEGVTHLDLPHAVEHCRSVAIETYRSFYRRERCSAWSDLTGGYDSRFLTLLLREAGVDFETNTVGTEQSADVRIASRVASVAGYGWRRFEIPSDWRNVLPDLIPAAVGWGDCHLDALQLAEVLWGHLQKAPVHRTLFIGGGGEHFRHRAWEQEFFNGGRSNRVNLDNWVDMMLLKPLVTRVFATDPTPEVRADMRARMAARAEPYSSCLNTIQLDIMHAYKNTGHFGAYLSAASACLDAELPFYLKPVFSAAFSTSYRLRNGRRLMRHLIETLDASTAAVSTETGGPAQPPRLSNIHRFLPYAAKRGRLAVTKISDRLISYPLLAPPAEGDPVRASARGEMVAHMDDGRPLRWEAMRCGRLFKRDALNDLLARASEPTLPETALLGRILTLELALRAVDAVVEE